MKIIYICSFYHRAMIFHDCIDALDKIGYDIKVFNTTWKGDSVKDRYKYIMTDKVIHKECYYKWERYLFFSKQYKMHQQLLKNYRLEDFDIIHAHNLFNGGISAYYSNKNTGIPFVVSVRASDISAFMKYSFFRKVASKIIKSAAGIQFLSEKHRNYFLNNFVNVDEKASVYNKSFIAYNGLETFWLDNIYMPKQLELNNLKFLFVGKVNNNKNILTVIKSIKILITKGYNPTLTVVGKVIDKDIGERIKQEKFVEVKEFMPKEELINIYRNSDIFIMPSKLETFGRVYAEAMTQGLPVIYTKGQGFDGIFEDGHVGFSVPSDNLEYIAESIIKIINNYEVMSANCINECKKFDWNEIASTIDKSYKMIIEEGE